MRDFIFHIPTFICFGKDSLMHIEDKVCSLGKTIMVVHGKTSVVKSGLYRRVVDLITQADCSVVDGGGVPQNPRFATVIELAAIAKRNGVDCLLAVGGGSVIDTCKILAAYLVTSDSSTFWEKHFEQFCPISQALPIAVVLTIPASGSETSDATVISDSETGIKRIACGPALIPAVSLLDPTSTFSLPAYQTACGCSDILSHLHERYFDSLFNNNLTDRLLETAIEQIIEIAPLALTHPTDYEVRSEVMWLGTIAHSQLLDRGRGGGDWACHMIEHALSGFCDIPHGAGLAILTPAWMQYIAPQHQERFLQYAERIWHIHLSFVDFEKSLELMTNSLKRFYRNLGLPQSLEEIGIQEKDLLLIAEASTSEAFPIGGIQALKVADVMKILEFAW